MNANTALRSNWIRAALRERRLRAHELGVILVRRPLPQGMIGIYVRYTQSIVIIGLGVSCMDRLKLAQAVTDAIRSGLQSKVIMH